jgi:hypothetical protein
MSVRICDRCGDVTLDGAGCTCTTPYSLSEVRRRYQAAVESARITASRDRARARAESGGVPRHCRKHVGVPRRPELGG